MNCLSSGKNWHFSIALAVLLISGATSVQAQDPAGRDRPVSVPKDFLATPMGYFHPSCVQTIAEGDVLHKDEAVIEHKDGSIEAIPVCAYPHYTPSGEPLYLDGEGPADQETDSAGSHPPGIGHAYVEAATMEKHPTNTYYGEIRANWDVPPDPTYHSNQIIYLFPGLEDYAVSKPTILQPVLGWNVVFPAIGSDPAINFPNAWSLASWNCCVNGSTQHTKAIPTSAGHEIFGQITCTNTNGAVCYRFQVNTVDQTTNKQITLLNASSFGLTFNWAFGAALEVYNLNYCDEYPETTSSEFFFLGLFDQDLQPVKQGWVPWDNWKDSNLTPDCNYGINGGFKSGLPYITLNY
jgi:hypothetical protein